MVSEQGPVTIGYDLSLAFHLVIQETTHYDAIYAFFSVQMCVLCEC